MKNIENNLIDFINKTPNTYYSVNNIKNILLDNGFTELYENEEWNLDNNNKYFVIRNDASLIAFKTNNTNNNFNIVAVHNDSPSFTIKSNPDIFNNYYLKLNINGYGGMINYSWFDRPLSIAGRVITKKNNTLKKELINIDKDLLIIPSEAIHINRNVNTNNEINIQNNMLPIISLSNEKYLKDIIRDNLEDTNIDKICDYDLYLYNRDKAKLVGLNNEFLLAPRLDDLASLYPSVISFINSDNTNSINMLCAFDNEEIGSLTMNGADSTFLIDTLTRICNNLNINIYTTLANSFIVSADNAHATHPNASHKNDPTNYVYLNKGIAIKHHNNYTTNSISSSLFKSICEKANVPYQDYACRSDMRCGATLGGISQSHVSIDSVDIGLPQLAMHSANETIGTKDILYMYKSILEFYDSTIIKEKNTIKILKK